MKKIVLAATSLASGLMADNASAEIIVNVMQGALSAVFLVIVGAIWYLIKFMYKKIFKS